MDRPEQQIAKPRSREQGLVSGEYAAEFLTSEASWHAGHGAAEWYLGGGMMYYAFVYAMRAKVAVCLGSGGAFVPRVMRQAQRDLRLPGSMTYLVDANLPEAGWGSPQWLSEESVFRKEFPEVKIIMETTDQAFEKFFVPQGVRIDYLHIDADHSYEGCMGDFDNYRSIMAESFVISIHDTDMATVSRVVDELRKRDGLELIDFPDIGRGVAFVRPRLPAKARKLYHIKSPKYPKG